MGGGWKKRFKIGKGGNVKAGNSKPKEPGGWDKFVAGIGQIFSGGNKNSKVENKEIETVGTKETPDSVKKELQSMPKRAGYWDQFLALLSRSKRNKNEEKKMLKGELKEKYELGELLGEGGFGKVYLASNRQNSETVVIKFMKKSLVTKCNLWGKDDEGNKKPMEVIYMEKLRESEGIVQIMSYSMNAKFCQIIMRPFGNGTTLDDFTEKSVDGLPAHIVAPIFRQIVKAAQIVNCKLGIVHCDIKPPNILFDEASGTIQFIDFGVSRPIDKKAISYYGTSLFAAPEAVMQMRTGITPAQDDWALGITLYIMLTNRPPFDNDNEILRGEFDLSFCSSEDLKALLCGLLNQNVGQRWTKEKMLSCAWLTEPELQ